jgi:DNA invertase Pin-like site-specific DNA recombinase
MKSSLAFSYIRFSHPDQAKGDSLRRQTELRDAWLARNGVTLDTSLTLEDKGISGFSGDHRHNPDRHALAAFLAAVEKKRIPRGSYLIVESLDRLSREDILPALTLVLNLIQSGIRVVQLLPFETVYDEKTNPMAMMMMIMELSRGHSESAMKSERVGRAWKGKKQRAAATGEALTARGPAWLRLVGEKWEVIDSACEAIRRIFRMASEGHGLGAITKTLNADGVPTIGAADYWARSYVAKILNNRAVVGEYQPHTGRGAKRRHDGGPIKDYFPAVISEDRWHVARAAISLRRGKPGRPSKERVNVFANLLFDSRDGGTLHQVHKGKKGGGRLLVPYNATQGIEGSQYVSFPFDTFERAVLSCLTEIDARQILPDESGTADATLAIAARLADVEAREVALKSKLADPRLAGLDALVEAVALLAAEKRTLVDQLTEARQAVASPLSEAWGAFQSLIAAVDAAPDPEEVRVRLRGAIRRVVKGVWTLFIRRGATRIAAVQMWFEGGGSRDYLVVHRSATGGSVGVRPARWWARSVKREGEPLDLRKPEDAARLEAVLNLPSLEPKGPPYASLSDAIDNGFAKSANPILRAMAAASPSQDKQASAWLRTMLDADKAESQ